MAEDLSEHTDKDKQCITEQNIDNLCLYYPEEDMCNIEPMALPGPPPTMKEKTTSYNEFIPIPLLGTNVFSKVLSPAKVSYVQNLGKMPLVQQINYQIRNNERMGCNTEQLLKFKEHPSIKISKATQKKTIRNNLELLKSNQQLQPKFLNNQFEFLLKHFEFLIQSLLKSLMSLRNH